ANYGFRNNVTLDTLRIEMIHNTIAVSPAYQIRTDAHTHVLSGSVSYSHFDEFNLFTARFQNTTSLSTSTTYQIVFHDRPLSLGAMAMYLINDAPMSEIRIFTSGLNARYRFFNQRLIPSARFTYSRIAREPFTADHRLRFQLRTTYKITEYADFNVSWNASTYRYGSSRPDAGIFENRLQVSLQTRF
ncbi:hypothetical protein QLX67_12190, partial [Balneolaceae bacterium ANBcel3]|nr:hypothetical protein [Balneolaceae bacterium ANBcel3]